MARRLGDSEALVAALHSRQGALTAPGRACERLAHSEEMLLVAEETANPEIEFLAHNARLHCYLELCDRWGIETETQAMAAVAERMRQPFYRWHTVCLRTLGATLDGRFADAERLAQEALELARLRHTEYPAYVFRYAQMLAIRWAQGRLHELWPEIRDHGERFPWIPRWRDALAAAELGDEEAARRELERHAVRGFAGLPRDGLWILHLCSLAEACVLVGDERRGRARRLHHHAQPALPRGAVDAPKRPQLRERGREGEQRQRPHLDDRDPGRGRLAARRREVVRLPVGYGRLLPGDGPPRRPRAQSRKPCKQLDQALDFRPCRDACHASKQFQTGRKRQAAGERFHFLFHHLLDLGLSVIVRGHDQVLEDLRLLGLEQRGIDLDMRHVALAAERDCHHAAARAAFDHGALKLGLHVSHAAL